MNCYDPGGNFCIETCHGDINLLNRDFSDFTCGGGGFLGSTNSTTATVVGLSLSAGIVGVVAILLDNGYTNFKELRNEVYDYSQELRQRLKHIPASSPHVHHIVPVGNFSNRNSVTYAQIQEMHSILRDAGISALFDPMNLVLVSAKTHASLHTDAYIAHVYSYISATDGSREEIYLALFWLRLEIAAQDGFSIGY